MATRTGSYRAIEDARQRLEEAEHAYLKVNGWEYLCGNPASLWLWEKDVPTAAWRGGKKVRAIVGTQTAIEIQRALQPIEDEDAEDGQLDG